MTQIENAILVCNAKIIALDELVKSRFIEMFGEPVNSNKVNSKFTDCVIFNPKKTEVKDLKHIECSFVPMECIGVDGSFSVKRSGTVSEFYKGYTYFRDNVFSPAAYILNFFVLLRYRDSYCMRFFANSTNYSKTNNS